MKIKRETFLKDLHMVRAGLSPREFIEQSSCFVFDDGDVMTFNDEVACRKEVGINITGAIAATSLMAILEKMNDEFLMVQENDAGEVEFVGKRKGFGVVKDAEIFLPVDKVDKPGKWIKLTPKFTEGVKLAHHCASSDESKFLMTCIHLHPDFIEACDNLQILRYEVKTGLEKSVLVRASSLGHIADLAMDQMSLTGSWVHFTNQSGLVFSCRRYIEDYPTLDKHIDFEGHSITIPKGLKDASDRAAVFAMDKAGDPLVTVKLKEGMLRIIGQGLSGWYREAKSIAYNGPPMQFLIAPELLKHISEKYSEAEIREDKNRSRLKVTGSDWEYVTVLGKYRENDEEEEKPKEKKKQRRDEEEE